MDRNVRSTGCNPILCHRQHYLCIAFVILIVFASGCSPYTRELMWENKFQPTPYEKPAYEVDVEQWSNEDVTYAWLGHASVLINFYGTLIVTDPVLLRRIGPPEVFDNIFGIRRVMQLPMDIESFPDIDVALISHPHFDHLDLASLRYLDNRSNYTLIVPISNSELIDDDIDGVIELDWKSRSGGSVDSGDVSISAFRVEHYGYADWGERDSKRGFNGYLITSNNAGKNESKTVAFFGDTSYSRYRDEQGDVLAKPQSIDWRSRFDASVLDEGIDLCIIPIGDSYYYWNHISPENALRLAREINCKKMLPMHYSTFILTPARHEPVKPKDTLLQLLETTSTEMIECHSTTGEMSYPDVGLACTLQ